MYFVFLASLLSFTFNAYTLEPRSSSADYPAQGTVSDMKVGAEYMVRSFLAENQSFTIDDYLLVEVSVYPQREVSLDLRRFTLRVNGKTVLHTQTPGMVAASVKYPDWTTKPQIVGGVTQADGRGVILGRNPSVGRWPGDPRQLPTPPQTAPSTVGAEKEHVDYEGLIQRHALPEGKFNKQIAGFLYFPYSGKLKSIKTAELLIDDQVLKLR